MMEQSEQTEPQKVITVTLNPSLDRTLTTHFLSLGYHNRVTDSTRLDPAGRGVGISRALHALGVPTHAIILIGTDPTGRAYETLLVEEEFPITLLRRGGKTRSNIHLVDTGHDHHTVILDESDGVTRVDRATVANMLLDVVNKGDTVVFGGNLPGQVRPDHYAALTSLVQTRGGAVAINAGGGLPLEKSIQARPLLVYLTQTQAEGLFNTPVRVYEDVIYFAEKVRSRGVRRVLIVMEQTEEAFLVTEDGVWMAEWPEISGNQTGRAEALIAGYLAGRLRHLSFEISLQLGAVMAAYTISQVGNEFATVRQASEQVDDVTVRSFTEFTKNL